LTFSPIEYFIDSIYYLIFKVLHRSLLPVVREGVDDGEPRAAVRAVYKGIAVAPVFRVKELLKALETIQSRGAAQVYIEIMAKAVPKPIKEVVGEESAEEASVKEVPTEDSVSSEPGD